MEIDHQEICEAYNQAVDIEHKNQIIGMVCRHRFLRWNTKNLQSNKSGEFQQGRKIWRLCKQTNSGNNT